MAGNNEHNNYPLSIYDYYYFCLIIQVMTLLLRRKEKLLHQDCFLFLSWGLFLPPGAFRWDEWIRCFNLVSWSAPSFKKKIVNFYPHSSSWCLEANHAINKFACYKEVTRYCKWRAITITTFRFHGLLKNFFFDVGHF